MEILAHNQASLRCHEYQVVRGTVAGQVRHTLRDDEFGKVRTQRHVRIRTRKLNRIDERRSKKLTHHRGFPGRDYHRHIDLATEQRSTRFLKSQPKNLGF